ncbi:MAG: peptide-methionine (S)-S-oxide reductase MsrA [Clostridiales bacterium]|nr:peptide-methionine (S)-S-oxide reductase MsrA [Clostridiales bacterium]
MKTIYLAGGCFWGCEKFFEQFDGVVNTLVGYANGNTENPSYEDVKHRGTGHAETVRIDFDEARISTEELLDSYFLVIDPLSVNRQGEDEGIQYRTGIYYDDESLLPAIRARVGKEERKLGQPLAVEVAPLENFYPAEEYHQRYLDKNPGGYCHIPERMMHLEKGEK